MGTNYQGTPRETRVLNAYIKLMRCCESLRARLNEWLNAEGLTESQFGILEALYHLGPMCQKDLGQKILKSGGNITKVVDNLEKRYLVERSKNQEDRRFFTVHLTADGEKLISEVFPRQLGRIIDQFEDLSDLELEILSRMCKRLGLQIREDEL